MAQFCCLANCFLVDGEAWQSSERLYNTTTKLTTSKLVVEAQPMCLKFVLWPPRDTSRFLAYKVAYSPFSKCPNSPYFDKQTLFDYFSHQGTYI